MKKEHLVGKSDEDLMESYQMGNSIAFEILFERHAGKIQGYLQKKIYSQKDAQDILQETFLKLHRSRHQYNSTLPFSPWLFSITRSALLDHLRKRKNENSLRDVFPENIQANEAVSATPVGGERAILNRLPVNQREAVRLRVFDDATFEEIANSLSTSPDNARQLVSRGLKRLKAIWGSRKEKP